MSKELQDQVALVTGGSRGFGFLLARELGRRGARVAICARDEIELEEAREDLSRDGIDALAVPCDVSDRAAVDAMVRGVVEHWGRLDLLLPNAGIIGVGPVESQRVADFERAMDVQYWGVVYPCLAALPIMKARKRGRIGITTSIGGKISVPHMLPYNASKAAAIAFSEGLRTEIAAEGISVTTIVPGLMRTGSYVQARFKGDARHEAAWFGVASSAPIISMDAERAARNTVDAILKGEAEIVLGTPARIAMWMHGVAPGLTARMLGAFERALPKDEATRGEGVEGEQALPRDRESYRAATRMGEQAQDRFQR